MAQDVKPYISPDVKLPETTVKAVILGVILSIVMAGANAYLGLFAGMTVSASIPAAVVSMAFLKLFKRSNILENNIVQTAASAGESLAAGVIFTLPSLVLMGYWDHFNYWETALIALAGGVLGVLFTIPLRNALIVREKLKFPEGVATSEVLVTGEEGGSAVKYLVISALVGGLMKLAEAGLHLWDGLLAKATLIGKKGYLFFGMNLSPALVGVGYIVGLNIASLVFIGGAISWWIAIPIYIAIHGAPHDTAVNIGYTIWSDHIRYLGVGAMVVGGFWALIGIRNALGTAFKEGLEAFKKAGEKAKVLRTEMDAPMSWVIIGIGVMIIPIFIIYLREIHHFSISAIMAVLMVFAGFLFSAVAGYMAGLVGSSNNPISGVTIATILSSALILLALMGTSSGGGAPAAILIGAVVCCAAAIAGDNMQDLKAGQLVGATPYRQQIMQMVGVVAAAMTLPFVLQLLNTSYGIGPKTPDHPYSLTAPQAGLMQSVAEGVFKQNLPWDIIGVGAILAVFIIIGDEILKRRKSEFRLPVLAVAIGLYLPFELNSSIFLGGIIAWLITRMQKRASGPNAESAVKDSDRTGLLFASGLITGEALIGIVLAIPVAVSGNQNVMSLVKNPADSSIGFIILLGICALLYYYVRKTFNKSLRGEE